MLEKAKIRSYLSAPQIAGFYGLKEEAAKFIVSRYHEGKFWLDEPVKITLQLIRRITGLPHIEAAIKKNHSSWVSK